MNWLGREKLCADIWHHRGLFLAQAGDTNVIKSVFKLDNILDISAKMPEHESCPPVVRLQTVTGAEYDLT